MPTSMAKLVWERCDILSWYALGIVVMGFAQDCSGRDPLETAAYVFGGGVLAMLVSLTAAVLRNKATGKH